MALFTRSSDKQPEEENNPAQHRFDDLIDKEFSPGSDEKTHSSDGGEASHKDGQSSEELQKQEEDAGESTSSASSNDEPDSTHRYVSGGKKGFFRNRLFKTRRRTAAVIAGILATIVTAAVLAFFALLPLKIVHLMSNIQSHFFATVDNATDKATDRMFQSYLKKVVLPELKTCGSTLNPRCKVLTGQGGGPIRQLYRAWSAGKLERKVALNYGIEFRYDNGRYYIRSPSLTRDVDITDFADNSVNDMFDANDWDTYGSTREFKQELNRRMRTAVAGETHRKQVFAYYQLRRLTKFKTGRPSCVVACSSALKGHLDDFKDWKEEQRNRVARIVFTSRILAPQDAMEKLVVECLFDKNCGPFATQGTPPDIDAEGSCLSSCTTNGKGISELESRIYNEILSLPDFDNDTEAKINRFNNLYLEYSAAKNPIEYRASKLKSVVIAKLTGLGKKDANDKADEAGDHMERSIRVTNGAKALPILGAIVQILDWGGTYTYIAKNAAAVGYVMKAATNATAFQTYMTYADELKEGKVDAKMAGEFTKALGSNMKSDMGGQASAENSPAYQLIVGQEALGNPTSISAIFGGRAQAAPTPHACQFGLAGVACMEERFDRKSRAQENFDQHCKDNELSGGVCKTAEAVNDVSREINDTFSEIVNLVCKVPLPGIKIICWVLDKAFALLQEIVTALLDFSGLDQALASIYNDHFMPKLSFSPNASGARLAQNIFAGASYMGNEAAHATLGGVKLTQEMMGEIVKEQEDARIAEYKNQPFFARMLDKESPYSPVSKLAMKMPDDPRQALQTSLASFISNPIGKILSSFGSLFNIDMPAFAISNPQILKSAPACNDLKDPQYEFAINDDEGNGLGLFYWQPKPPHKYEDFVPRGVKIVSTGPDGRWGGVNPDGSGFDGNNLAPNWCDPAGGNPWGISEYGYPQDHPIFKADPEAYFDQNCRGVAKYLIYNDKGVQDANPTTGQAENWYEPGAPDRGANPCALLRETAKSAGAVFDPKMLSDEEIAEDGGSDTTPPPGGGTPPPSGNAQQLAQQVLNNSNIDLSCYRSSVLRDVRAAAAGRPGTAGAMTSANILRLIAAVGQNHRVCITAIQSDGQGHSAGSKHYDGLGVDFGSLDGTALTGRDPKSVEIINIALGVIPEGSGFGQSNCSGATVNLPAGYTQFSDTCHHLHVQVPN